MESNRSILLEASQWVIKLNSDNVSKQDKVNFSNWLIQSHVHKAAFDEQLSIYEVCGALPPLPEAKTEINQGKSRAPVLSFWLKSSAVFSGILCVFIVCIFSFKSKYEVLHYKSNIGQLRELVLNDKSTVSLNTNTSLTVAYSDKDRKINLHRGEAYFGVEADIHKPFVVAVGKVNFIAVGTEFSIYRKLTSSELLVTEGTVAVQIASGNPMYVEAGEKAVVSEDTIDIDQVAYEDLNIQWLDGHLGFDGTPLVKVIDELNRYLVNPVVLSEKSLFDIQVTGGFQLSEPEDNLKALLAGLDLSVDKSGKISSLDE